MDNSYCSECGNKLIEHLIKKFDVSTGTQLKGMHCPNLKCEKGCGFEGHIVGIFGSTCKRCGYTYCDNF